MNYSRRRSVSPGVSCGEACFSLPAHQGRIGLALNHSLDKFAHTLAYPSFDRIEPVVEQINRCVGGGGPTATFSGISAVGREGEARWLATADGERMMSVGPIGSTLRHKKALGRLTDRGDLPLPWGVPARAQARGHHGRKGGRGEAGSGRDAVAVAVYSVLVLLLMLAWTYVPA